MLRKIALVATSVFLTGTTAQAISLQLSMMMGILFACLVAQMAYRPHSNNAVRLCTSSPPLPRRPALFSLPSLVLRMLR